MAAKSIIHHLSEESRSVAAMFSLQVIYAGNNLLAKAAFTQGMSPYVFVAFRQTIAALVLIPICSVTEGRNRSDRRSLGMIGFGMVFLTSLVGACVNQVLYMQGLKLSSPSVATAVCNLVPAITFVMAASIGLEKVDIRSLRSIAKIIGTVISVGGAVFIALFKGQKLLTMENFTHLTYNNMYHAIGEDWIRGCFLVLASNCCWSINLILQVTICKHYLDPLSLSTWMSFISVFQASFIAYYFEPDLQTWKIHSGLELVSCLYVGTLGTAVTFYGQSWCIARRGPLFSAMFSPLCTVITTILACIFLHEQLYLGSLLGATAVVIGLYAVLWGKSGDVASKRDPNPNDPLLETDIPEEQRKVCIREPLLSHIREDIETK